MHHKLTYFTPGANPIRLNLVLKGLIEKFNFKLIESAALKLGVANLLRVVAEDFKRTGNCGLQMSTC